MLLDLKSLISKYSLKIVGVIQVGANTGQETPLYLELGYEPIVLIEPCGPAYRELMRQYGGKNSVTIHNFACASYTGEAAMFIETANKGQSNSLLKPVNHLKYYPDIKFRDTELVQVRPLDSVILPAACNFLNMDVQGAECQVLIGGKRTLDQIHYVYTEVNKDDAELYEGACGITELDAILHEFDRVETKFTQQGWGDALYVRRATK